MKLIQIASTGFLSLILGVGGPAYAQHDQQGDKQDRPQEHPSQREPAKREQQHPQQQRESEQKPQAGHSQQQQQRQVQHDRQQHAQRQQSDRTAQQHAQQQRQDQNNRQEHAQQQQSDRTTRQHAQRQDQNNRQQHAQQRNVQRTPQQQQVVQSAWRQHGSRNWDSDHRNWGQRGGYHGYRIPDDRFRGYFGSNHGFHIYGLPFLVVSGYPRFQYEGYWFSPVDPWPEYWGSNWYDNDEVYVVYADNGYYMYNRRYPTMGIAINISM